MPPPKDPEKRKEWIDARRKEKGKPQNPETTIKIIESKTRRSVEPVRKIHILLKSIVKRGYDPTGNEIDRILGKPFHEWYAKDAKGNEKDDLKGLIGHYTVLAIALKYGLPETASDHFNAEAGEHEPDVTFQYKGYCVAVEVKYYYDSRLILNKFANEDVFPRFNKEKYKDYTKLCVVFGDEILIPYLETHAEAFYNNKIALCLIPKMHLHDSIRLLSSKHRLDLYVEPYAQWILPLIEHSHNNPGKFFPYGHIEFQPQHIS